MAKPTIRLNSSQQNYHVAVPGAFESDSYYDLDVIASFQSFEAAMESARLFSEIALDNFYVFHWKSKTGRVTIEALFSGGVSQPHKQKFL